VVSFPLRMSPLCRKVRALIDTGVLGTPEHLLGVNYVPYGNVYFDSWYRDYQTTQGLFLQKATHDFDYLSYLAGAPIVRVAAMLSRDRVYRDSSRRKNDRDESALFHDRLGTPETGMNEDSSSALLEFANGAQGVYTQVFYSKRDAAARGATVSGRKATLSFDWYQAKIKLVHHREPFTETIAADSNLSHFGGDEALGRNFVDVVANRAESLSPLVAGLQSVYACLAARQSAHEGRFVEVRQIGKMAATHRNGKSNGRAAHTAGV
jgi:predicted dehydrogenase